MFACSERCIKVASNHIVQCVAVLRASLNISCRPRCHLSASDLEKATVDDRKVGNGSAAVCKYN